VSLWRDRGHQLGPSSGSREGKRAAEKASDRGGLQYEAAEAENNGRITDVKPVRSTPASPVNAENVADTRHAPASDACVSWWIGRQFGLECSPSRYAMGWLHFKNCPTSGAIHDRRRRVGQGGSALPRCTNAPATHARLAPPSARNKKGIPPPQSGSHVEFRCSQI